METPLLTLVSFLNYYETVKGILFLFQDETQFILIVRQKHSASVLACPLKDSAFLARSFRGSL